MFITSIKNTSISHSITNQIASIYIIKKMFIMLIELLVFIYRDKVGILLLQD